MKSPANRHSARFLAGAFLLLAAAPLFAERIRIAAERPDASCPSKSPPLGILRFEPGRALPADLSRCVVIFPVDNLSAAAIDEASGRLARLRDAAGIVLDFSLLGAPPAELEQLLPYALKRLSSSARSATLQGKIAVRGPSGVPGFDRVLQTEEIAPYFDADVIESAEPSPHEATSEWDLIARRWSFAPARAATDPVSQALHLLRGKPGILIGISAGDRTLSELDWLSLQRLQAYWTDSVSRDPTATRATRPDGFSINVLRFFDAKAFTPILFLSADVAGPLRIELSGGSYAKASAENLVTGGKREFDLRDAKSLTLDLSRGPLAVVLHPAARKDSEKTQVEVGAARGLTAEEIVARERAWETGQREAVESFIAEMNASLRFRVAEVNETFDLTIRGPFFFRRGEPADWAWKEFYLNGVKWKGKTLPKIPILQPEKVTTLPLDIRLTEEYRYELAGEADVAGRRAYVISYSPKTEAGDKPIYRGTVWIDAETFALLRRESIQLNLRGETLSNIQNEYSRPVPERSDLFLPLEIRGQQVFSTAGRTTAIERHVTMSQVAVNPPDFLDRRTATHASETQMVRDTEKGLRYLVPDPAAPGSRVVEETISKKSTFALAGTFYDDALDFPIPLLGIQHFNFDLWGKGKQLSVFFGGALLTANYTDPSLAGGRFDLGADLFAVAFPFGDVSYRDGKEVPEEKIKRLPAVLQVNIGRPLGPYLKTSVGLFTRWDNYQRDPETGPAFVTPVDTFTDGAEVKLVGNVSGFNAMLVGTYYRRREWDPWGNPATREYDPGHQDYLQYGLSFSKDQYFRGFRKLHVKLSYLGGKDLDRFSKYEFGFFSGHPLRGFKNGSVKTQEAFLANVSYGLNIEDIIRFEGFYDQAIVRDRGSGFDNTYFSGAGLLASLNGPWKNSLIRAEVGVPVVSHGIKGFVVNVLLLKLF